MTAHAPQPGELPYFSEENSVEAVNARIGPNTDPRLAQMMQLLVKHLHAFVKEAQPTHDEWLGAIDFLTRTGQKCTDWRQEFILLSDTLGVSSLVDAVNHRRPSGATENTILGPFYVAGPPRRAFGDTICLDGKGEPLRVHGRVIDTAGQPVPGATLDVWQTNNDGFYDVQQKGVQPDMNMRGLFTADAQGRYAFASVKPRYYPIPNDGPVGQMLSALGRDFNRAAHVHAIVAAPGYETVITHIFEPGCKYLREDAVFGVKHSLIGNFRRVDDPARVTAAGFGASAFYWDVATDFVLAKARG